MLKWWKIKFQNESIFWCIFLAGLFFISYGYTNYWSSKLSSVPSLFFLWERQIPFVPWMIFPYLSSDLIFVACFLMLPHRTEVRLLAKRIGFMILFSILCYLMFPLKVSFSRPDLSGTFYKRWFDLLSADLPFNQCPSLHVSEGLIFWIIF